MARQPTVAPSGDQLPRRQERPQGLRREDDARVSAQEARLDELQAQLAQVVSVLHTLRPRKSHHDTNYSDQSSDDDSSDASDATSAPSRATSIAEAPPSVKRDDHSPAATRPPSQRRRHQTSSRPSGVQVHPLKHASAIPEPTPPSAQRPASARQTTTPASPTAPERLAKADLKRLATTLDPAKVSRWIEELLQTFQDYSPDTSWFLGLPAPAAREALDQYAFLRPLDRWAARQAINTFVVDAPYVQMLLTDTSPEAVAARTSGIELLEFIRDRASAAIGESSRLRIAQFDAKVYFRPNMDIPATHLGANELRSDFQALPVERTAAPNALLRVLLAKLPASIAKQASSLEDKLIEAEAMKQPPPWNFDQLVYVSAQYILVAARRAAANGSAQVNVLEARGKKDQASTRTGPSKCPCCGKQGHPPRECPTTCNECKQRSCPGNYGSPCVVNTAAMPDPILNALGKPIPPNIKAFLLKARQLKKGTFTTGQKAATKQANAVEAMPLSDENAHIWEIMDDAGKSANVLLAAPAPEEPSESTDRMREACPTFKSADGTIVRTTPRMIMMDGGSNINLFNHSDVPRLGFPVPSAPVQVSGWSDAEAHSVLSSYRVDLQIKFSDGAIKHVTTQVAYSDQARRDILSESTMWDEHQWSARKEPDMRIDTPIGPIPLLRLNGVYFVEALVLPPRLTPMSTRAETNALSAKRDGALHLSRLWAARLHAGSAALRRQLPACSGMGVDVLTPAMAKVADQDVLNKRSNTRRPAAPRSSSAPTKPGELFILDAFGPVAAQSVLDGSHYELEAVCACTGYGYEVSTHSLSTQTQWISFIGGLIANERSLGHEVQRLRFDRAPNLHADSFQHAIHLQFRVAVEFAGRHEGVGAVEQRNDHKQRIAEADLMRAERTQSYLLPARIYAGWRINRRVAEGSTKTRLELHTGRRPDFSDPVPYLFGIACSVLEDENERGPKGAGCSSDSLHKGRTSAGVFVGIIGRSYKVRLDRGVTVERRHITPHDEQILLLRGGPSSAVSVDASTSTEGLSSQPALQSKPHPSSVHESLREPPSSRTRSKRAIDATVSLVEAHLEAAPLATISASFDDALFQFRPDVYELCAFLSLDEARALLSRSPPSPADKLLECCKATADVVQVQTDIGIQEYRVPATHLARERAPDALEWRRADEAALQVLLNTQSRNGRRNVLVPVSKPVSLGQPIIPSVLQRRIKTDPVTKKLIKRKSRLCASGDRQKIIQQNAGTYVPRQAHADAADDILIKTILAVAARPSNGPPLRRVKLDIGNAYSRGIRLRPVAYMSLGKSLARVSDAGEELCLELHTPTYGEEPSGDEWGGTFDGDIVRVGWQSAEAVPALYYFLLPEGARAFFIRVVDDVLLVFPPQCRSVAENTIACFKQFYHGDVSVEWDPTSFVGYAILDDPETGAITLNMASHVEHAVRQYLPGLLQSPPVRPSASLPRGQSFQSLADSLQHQPATKPLTEQQTRVQRMVGAMRYPEKVLPVLTLGLHRLSCVAQNPPPAATLVADLLLEIAFDHRFEGLTYGGAESAGSPDLEVVSAYGIEESTRPPDNLVGYGDATWAAGLQHSVASLPPLATLGPHGGELASRDLYSVVLTFRSAAILHQTKKLALLVDCSMAAEEVATSKAAEYIEYASQIMRALGTARCADPVPIGTDNASNRQVAMRQGASARSKHLLRRYYVLMQRVMAGEVRVVHVKDEANPADFLTKWVPARKLRSSVAYITGQSARRKGFVQQAIQQRRAPSGAQLPHA